MVAAGMRRGLVSHAELLACLLEVSRVHGAGLIRRVLDEVCPQDAHTRNEFELLYLRTTLAAGLPVPIMNYPTRDVYGNYREVDAAYFPEVVAVELEGKFAHTTPLDQDADRRRQNALTVVHWNAFLRFTWQDLTEEPERVVFEVGAALEAARRRLGLA